MGGRLARFDASRCYFVFFVFFVAASSSASPYALTLSLIKDALDRHAVHDLSRYPRLHPVQMSSLPESVGLSNDVRLMNTPSKGSVVPFA